jgi:hypothetical protein
MATKTPTQNRIVFQNFASMYPEVPEYSVKNQHYLLGNVDPFYYLYSQVHEKQYAPLVAAKQVGTAATALDMSSYGLGAVAMIQDSSPYNAIYLTTDNQHTYAWRYGTLTDLGKPSGATGAYAIAGLAIYNGNLVATYGNSSVFYTQTLSGSMNSGSWVTRSSTIVAGGWLVPFLQYCFNGGGNSSGINQINSSWVVSSAVLDLGAGWGIPKAVNWNNKYLAFVGQQNQNNSDKTNYLFLWDGISKTYNYAIAVPGVYKDIYAHPNGDLYLTVSNGGIQQLLVLSGLKLKPVFEFPLYEVVNNYSWYGYISKMFSFGKYLGIIFTSAGGNVYSFILIYDPTKKSKYIIYSRAFSTNADNLTNAVGIGNAIYLTLADGIIYYYSTGNSNLAPINYVSQNIPLNGTIDSVEVYYDAPPTGSATINVSIVSLDEDAGSATTNLTQITSSNYLNQNKTILDAGVKCNVFKLILTTSSFSEIRKIVVNYTPFI